MTLTPIMDWLESPVTVDDELRQVAAEYRDASRLVEAEAFWIAALRHDPDCGYWFSPEFWGLRWVGDCTEWTRLDLLHADPVDSRYFAGEVANTDYWDPRDGDPMGELER